MKRITIMLNGGEFINVPADRMEIREDAILAWSGGNLVAYADIGSVVCAHISEKG